MNDNKDILNIIGELLALRSFQGKEEQFWKNYLTNIGRLTKSSYTFIVNESDGYVTPYEENPKNIADESKKEIFNQSLSCIEKAKQQSYAFEKLLLKKIPNHFILAINLDTGKENTFLIVLIENSNKLEFSNLVIRALLCKDIPKGYFKNDDQSSKIEQVDSSSSDNKYFEIVLNILNSINNEEKFQLASMKVVERLANSFESSKVSLGWQENDYVKTIAINQIESFQRSSPAIKSLEAVFEESVEQNEEIYFPNDENSILITHAHNLYQIENKLENLYSFPLRIDEKVLGVITLEKSEGFLNQSELDTIRLILNYLSVYLYNIYKQDLNFVQKSVSNMNEFSTYFLGPKDSFKKLLLVSFTLLLLWIVFGKMEYKVESVANIETDNIAYLSAPFDGVIHEVNITTGDFVSKDQILAKFDTQELSLRKLEISSDIVKYNTEIEKTRANRALADMKIAQARKSQSMVSLKKVQYYLDKAVLDAPFDGIVVQGDEETLLGSPFTKGDLIIQIANPTELYGKLKISERYIDEIKVGQIATLNLLSKPDVLFDVKIDKIIPVAEVDDLDGNVFIVKVVFLDELESWIRPGMSGVAKVKIEDRAILWILTHKLSDYFHMNIWW